MLEEKTAMAATFTEVSLDEMDKFIKRGWRALRPKQGTERREVYYDLSVSDFVIIRVWTSIGAGRETGADVGSDAIRIQLLAKKSGRPLVAGKSPIVKRTQGWKNNLQDRIEDYLELYEEKDEYFDQRAGGEVAAPVVPERDRENEERQQEQELREERGGRPEAKATFTKLKNGDWGLRVQGRVSPGDRVIASRANGSSQVMTCGEVVWSGQDRTTGMFITVTTIGRGARTASCCGGTGIQPDGQPCQCGCNKTASEDDYSYDRSV